MAERADWESEYRKCRDLLRLAYEARSHDEGLRVWADVARYLEATRQ